MTTQRAKDDDVNNSIYGRSGGPWWMRAIYQVGVPSAIAIYLVYNLTSTMPTKAEVLALNDQLKTHVSSTITDLSEIKRVLTVTCVNAAGSDEKRRQCLGDQGR